VLPDVIGVEGILILHNLLDHLIIVIHVYKVKKLLKISGGKGGKNHGWRRHSVRWSSGVTAAFGAESANNRRRNGYVCSEASPWIPTQAMYCVGPVEEFNGDGTGGETRCGKKR
jgi:hypothetical protein